MKNNNLMEYNGYYGSVLVSVDDEVMHGKIECISDVVTYEADNIPELKIAFHQAVDDYIETCLELGKEPEKRLSGTFNVRIGSDLHKTVYIKAKGAGISINDFVKKAIEEKLEDKKELHIHLEGKQSKNYDFIEVGFELNQNWSMTQPTRKHKVHH